ncbi:glycerol 3-phosphate dehydrogenase (NAD(P)+) [Ectothiorhodosinus mongolicus]|uniref:Glycerol-3-phosphate dehydrogenase [NAD(P)+] n=1 Tax=Ectothiorhodosinus mongolicus TaxID=233100 RepID=A0A1R3VVD8_9GAMM|nr:glycerol 3-phosphate dehydrogenase (NAD(P)+) [Ectothiorhodosinus mongolicus]
MLTPAHIGVLGAGSWGTALAMHLARQGHHVALWGRDHKQIEEMLRQRCNPRYLPGITFPETLTPTSNLSEAVRQAEQILLAVPSGAFVATLEAIQPWLKERGLVWATKGLDREHNSWLHERAQAILGDQVPWAIASGPSFAAEVACGLPTALTLASRNKEFAQQVRTWLSGGTLRIYTSDDVLGVQLGGALKNVLAIAAGVSDGLGFGANARAALITRGLAEMMRLGEALGARQETLMGLSGLGDLVLTCTDDQSRNRRLGIALGHGQTRDQAVEQIGQAVEGVYTAGVVLRMAEHHGVEMPISEQVSRVLFDALPPAQAVQELLGREPKPEF